MNLTGIKNNTLPLIAIVLSLSWWVYLFFSTQMLIAMDALGYEHLGRLIQQKGWENYFIAGPNREPFYPWFISISMTMAAFWNTSYIPIQKIFQIIVFCFSQLLLFKLLLEFKIRPAVSGLILIYFGFSPALVNSVFSLYSEIVTYPFILGIIMISFAMLKDLPKAHWPKVRLKCVYLTLMFLCITFTKGIFEYICPVFLVCLLIIASVTCVRNRREIAPLLISFFFIFVFCVSLNSAERFLNKK